MKPVGGATKLDGALERLAEAQADELPEDSRKLSIKAAVFGDPVPPRRIGRFVDLSLLGHGAMGTVRRAYDERLAREVAIKLVRHGSMPGSPGRMLREAQALAQLSHPNVVQIYEVGQLDGEMFIAMELVHGETLHQWQGQRHSWRECVRAYVQAGRGLAAAHAVGLVHRDFKPANCIRDERGRVRVLDFGLARAVDPAQRPSGPSDDAIPIVAAPFAEIEHSKAPTDASGTVLQQRFTDAKAVVGTVAYMAPEQYIGQTVDAKSDQFSFCVALYEALYGELPFSKDPRSALVKMSGGVAVSPGFPAGRRVPRGVRNVLRRGLAGEPEARWGSMEALLQALERRLREAKAGPVTVGALVAGTALLSSFMTTQPRLSLDEVWGDEQRELVRERFPGSSIALEVELDGYVAELSHAFDSTPWYERSALTCLENRRVVLGDRVEAILVSDRSGIKNAKEIVKTLPSIDRCTRPDFHEEQEALARRLDKARFYGVVGKYDEALAEVEAAKNAAGKGSALLADAWLVEGNLHMRFDEFEAAKKSLERAREIAMAFGAHNVTLEAASTLGHVVEVELGQAEDAEPYLEQARVLAKREELEPSSRASALTNWGHSMRQRGEYSGAREQYEHAISILEEAYGGEDLRLVQPLEGMAQSLKWQGKLGEALAPQERALKILRENLGDAHPDVAHSRSALATILYTQEKFGPAEEQLQSALDSFTKAELQRSSDYAEVETNFGALLEAKEDYGGAEAAYRNALEIWEESRGKAHRLTLKTRLNLAGVLAARKEYDRAVAEYETVFGICRELGSCDAELTVMARYNMGVQYLEHGLFREADRSFERGLEMLEAPGASDPSMKVSVLASRGKVAMKQGDPMTAEGHYREALKIHEATPQRDRAGLARTRYYLALSLVAQQQWARADEQVVQALNIYDGLEMRIDGHVEDAQKLRREIQSSMDAVSPSADH